MEEDDSFFNYSIDGTSYSAINDGFNSYIPTFTENIITGASAVVRDACMNDQKCIFDYLVTGDEGVGVSTFNISMGNDATVMELGENVILLMVPADRLSYKKYEMLIIANFLILTANIMLIKINPIT